MPQIKANFVLNSKMPNFSRDSFKRLEDMRIVNTDHIDDGHISYCEETKKHYIFRGDLSHNTETGYWRELTFEDSIVFDYKDDMLNIPDADIKRIPVGKIALCKEDGKLYFNAYYLGEENKSNETGYWKILVDIEDNTYVPDYTLSQTLETVEGEEVDNEAVAKSALIAKFSEISNDMLAITDRLDSLELPDATLGDLRELVETQGDVIDEIGGRISAIETVINGIPQQEDGEEVLGLKSRVEVLEDKHIVCSKSYYESLGENEIIPEVFYYVYEEEN
jgi:hypothetical protein